LANQANQVTPDKSSVFLIAKQHSILTFQIERWRKQFEIIDATIIDATITTMMNLMKVQKLILIISHGIVVIKMRLILLFVIAREKQYICVSSKNLTRCPGGGRKSVFSENMMDGLKAFYFEQRELTNSVSVMQLRIHDRNINDAEVDAILSNNVLQPNHAIKQRLRRLLKTWDQLWRRGTHRAQNTRYEISIQNDFTSYVNQKIKRLGISKEHVFNVDETNIPFVMEQLSTWGQKADDTIAIRKADTTNRLSCLLGTNTTGSIKLPPHVCIQGYNRTRQSCNA
jgi:hypothetical protein